MVDTTDSKNWSLNPWHPMTDAVAVKHLGNLAEELGEAQSAVARCIIQGIDECEPVTKKINREWLEDEIADVIANIELTIAHFKLDITRIHKRTDKKKVHLQTWHRMA
jgi:NTP pyrophosphatase (non-canonical NTP hydrolase)